MPCQGLFQFLAASIAKFRSVQPFNPFFEVLHFPKYFFFFFLRERRHTLWWRIAERQVGFSELLSPAQKNHVSVHHENPATVDFSDGTPCHPRCDDLVLCQECENFGIKYQLILFIANSWPLRHPLANRAGRVAAHPKSVRRVET